VFVVFKSQELGTRKTLTRCVAIEEHKLEIQRRRVRQQGWQEEETVSVLQQVREITRAVQGDLWRFMWGHW
jgi:sugar diacid utilization regulator